MSASVTSQPCEGNLSTPSVSLPALSLSFFPCKPTPCPPGGGSWATLDANTQTHTRLPAQTPPVWICSHQQLNAETLNCFSLSCLSWVFQMTWNNFAQSWNAIQISHIQDSPWTLKVYLNLFGLKLLHYWQIYILKISFHKKMTSFHGKVGSLLNTVFQ